MTIFEAIGLWLYNAALILGLGFLIFKAAKTARNDRKKALMWLAIFFFTLCIAIASVAFTYWATGKILGNDRHADYSYGDESRYDDDDDEE